MNSHLESFHLNMTSNKPNDSVYNYSHAMNRSKMLLDEMASSPSKFGNKSTLAFQNATVFSTSLLSNTMVDQRNSAFASNFFFNQLIILFYL